MPKVLVAYATRTGDTQDMANYIAEGIRFSGVEAKVVNASEIRTEEDLTGYDAYVFGSATYHGEMMQAMKTLLFLAAKLDLSGKTGGSFGAYGWSGEAPERIYETMRHILKMDMVDGPLRLKTAVLQGGPQMAQDYGRGVGRRIGSSIVE
jgi:flavorubredoxin